jgi:hypothetical protein
MNIQLNDKDIAKMPTSLREKFLVWLGITTLTTEKHNDLQTTSDKMDDQKGSERSQIRLTQLLDAGITRPGMQVRVRLMREQARNLGRDYLDGLTISQTGAIVYEGEEFNKPSPLAKKINGCSANGWEYIEIKKDGAWKRLETLRKLLNGSK